MSAVKPGDLFSLYSMRPFAFLPGTKRAPTGCGVDLFVAFLRMKMKIWDKPSRPMMSYCAHGVGGWSSSNPL
jgi:hypothetical protein